METDENLIAKIENVLGKFEPVAKTWHKENGHIGYFQDQVALNALSIEICTLANFIYGKDDENSQRIKAAATSRTLTHLQMTEGLLRGTIAAIKSGLLTDLRKEILLDIQADFIEAARTAITEGAKDVAAALLCIVLEDSVKRLAAKHNLATLQNQEFTTVVVGLYSANAITKATKGVLLAQKDLRNSALHAQWHEVSVEAVQGLLNFLPTFIEYHGV